MVSDTAAVRALVLDFFCSSAFPVAEEFGVPAYYFFTSGAAALAGYFYFPTIDGEIGGSFRDLVNTQIRIPGLPMLRAVHMPEPVLDRNDPAYNDILYFSLLLQKSNGILVNTFEYLEPIPIKAIANGSCVPNAPTPPIYYIGPIISQHDNSETSHKCLTWLDQQPRKSVVFLCFGSRGSFSLDQIKEIANGLEQSGHRFLWVVKRPVSNGNSKQIVQIDAEFDLGTIVPHGFLERTAGKGMVVESWAPQAEVLAHVSVGGFVTHCGWNSVLEAVVVGVPMIAWPLYAEQYVNRAALVEDMKMAIAVEQREGDGFVTGDELERRVRELMDSERGRELREWSSRMREEALTAWGESGSSSIALDNLVQTWS